MSMSVASRPRSAPEIVDGAIQLVRHNYLPLVTVATIGYVPFTVIQLVAFRGVLASAAGAGLMLQPWGLRPLGYFGFAVLWSALIDLSLIVAAADVNAGRPIDIAGVFRLALPRVVPTLIAVIIRYVLVGIYGALCLAPVWALRLTPARDAAIQLLGAVVVFAFIVGTLYMFGLLFAATAAIALEGTGPIAGLRRSVQLSRTHIGHILGGLALAYIIYFVGQSPAFFLAAAGGRTVVQFLSVGTTILLTPVVSATRMLLYYDARIRNEGYDLELMAQSIAVTAAPQLPN